MTESTSESKLDLEKKIKEVVSKSHISLDLIPPVPEHRKLKIGAALEIGFLDNCFVIDLQHEGRVVVVEYSSTDNNYGKPVTTDGLIGAWPWTEVIPVSTIKDTGFASQRRGVDSYRNVQVSSLISDALRRGFHDSPDYQRDYVWTLKDKRKYIDSVFNQRELGKFVFLEDDSYVDYKLGVLDGKQRLNALLGFHLGEYDYQGVFWHELSALDRRLFEGRMVQSAHLNSRNLKRSELLQIFLDINCAGVPQTEDHLSHVRELLDEALAEDYEAST